MADGKQNRNIAVVFAGGVGSRMGHPDGPKQFIEVNGKPILIYTLEHFEKNNKIDAVYLSVLESHIPHTKGLLSKFNITKVKGIASGGDTAHESIFNALKVAAEDADNNDDTVVLIHDGVRPVINKKIIDDNVDAAREFGSSISSIPAFETIAESLDGGESVERVTNRDLMYVLQAPQGFRLQEIYKINRQALEDGVMGTFIDQAHMMNHYGYDLHMTAGFRGNVKVTVPMDLTYFRFLVESGEFKNVTGESIDV